MDLDRDELEATKRLLKGKGNILDKLKAALEDREPNGYTKIDTNILRDTIELLESKEKEKTRKLVYKEGQVYEFKEV